MKTFNIIKNILAVLGVVLIGLLVYTKLNPVTQSWNKETGVDMCQEFTKAYISTLDGRIIEVPVKSWRDYEYSDQIQITTPSGTTYLTHASRLILTNEKMK